MNMNSIIVTKIDVLKLKLLQRHKAVIYYLSNHTDVHVHLCINSIVGT